MNSFPEPRAAAPDTQPWTAGEQGSRGHQEQMIVQWSVVGRDRLIGTVRDCVGRGAGRTVMTSPVVQVRLVGERGWPVALTESGSAYRLGEPAEAFGQARAERFVSIKSRQPTASTVRHPGMETAALKLAG